jgi:hypothetical protein
VKLPAASETKYLILYTPLKTGLNEVSLLNVPCKGIFSPFGSSKYTKIDNSSSKLSVAVAVGIKTVVPTITFISSSLESVNSGLISSNHPQLNALGSYDTFITPEMQITSMAINNLYSNYLIDNDNLIN